MPSEPSADGSSQAEATPRTESLTTQTTGNRLHPISLLFGIGTAAWALVALVIFSRVRNPFLIAALLIPAIATSILKYVSFRFWLGPDEMVIREGILRRNERHIPYARIQNIDLIQSLFHRLFKVAVVRLETASGGKPEAIISVLTLSTVETMRDHVFADRTSHSQETDTEYPSHGASEASATAPPATDDAPILALSLKDLVIFGILSNKGMVIVAAALGLLGQSGYFEDPRWMEAWQTNYSVLHLPAFPSTLTLGLLLMVGLLVLTLALKLLSVLWAILKFHAFRLQFLGEDLRTQYGLLTKVTATIPRHRIQLITIILTPIHRWFGRASIQVDTAGGGGGDPSKQGNIQDRQWLAPVIPRREVLPLLRKAMPESRLEGVEWRPIAIPAWRRLFVRRLALALILSPIAFFLIGSWGLIPIVAALPLAFAHARRYVQRTGYALTPAAVLYRSGSWIRRLSVVPFAKIQTLTLRQTPFDRRHAMATVQVDTAGASSSGHRIAIAYLDFETARRVIDRLDREAGRTAFRW